MGIVQSKISRNTRSQFRAVSGAKRLELVIKSGHDAKIVTDPVRRRLRRIVF